MPRANRPARGGKRPGSGRPPGRRNNIPRDVSLLAQDFSAEGLMVLVEIMRDKKQPAASRISAVGMIFDRGHGRAPAAVDLSLRYANLEQLSDAELTAIIRHEQAYRTGKNGPDDERDLH